MPFYPATRIGKLLPIVQSTARPDDSVGKMAAGALKQIACLQRMRRRIAQVHGSRKMDESGRIGEIHSAGIGRQGFDR